MRFREFLLPLVTGLAIFSMSVFISCASKSRIDEDGNEIEETSVTESGDEPGSSAPAKVGEDNLGDLPPSNDKVAEAAPPPPTEPTPDAVPPPSDVPPPPGGDLAELPPDTAPPPADSLPADAPPAPAGDIAAAVPPPADAAASADALPPASDLPPAVAADLPPAIGDAQTNDAPKVRGAVGDGGGVPKIPANAVTRAGTELNRFYFVRKGDTKSSVAEMIYGDAAKGADLGKWNKGEFAAGRLVFYKSPALPDDKEMKPFYQEKSIAPVEYTVKKGDWLSRIASKKLGSGASWKEIAVLNGISNASGLEVGSKLSLFPLNGDGQAMAADNSPAPVAPDAEPVKKGGKKKRGKKSAVAENEPSNPNFKSGEAPAPAAPEAPLIQAEGAPTVAVPTPLPTESVPPVETFKKKKKSGGFDLLRLIEQNLFFLILGLGVAVLVVALIFVNKRRKAKAAEAEFGDDAFASPKAKRR